jgi:beta-glucanase (GH16 family)
MRPPHRPSRVLLLASAVLAATLAGGAEASEVEAVDGHPRTFHSTKAWKPGKRTALDTVRSSAYDNVSLALTPKRDRTTTVVAVSKPVGRSGVAGTRVTASVRLRSTMPDRRMSVELREIGRDGRLLQKQRRSIRPDHTRWRAVSARLTLEGSASRLSVRVAGASIRPGESVRVNALRVVARGGRAVPPPSVPGALVPAPAPAPAPAASCRTLDYSRPEQGRLAFQDDFDGTAVDPSKWRVRDRVSLSYDLARIQKENVSVAGGVLSIAARQEASAGRAYTTGYLDSIGTFSQKYGRWEMRAKVPTTTTNARGIWPAFWLRADGGLGEIDVMESWGEPTVRPDYRSGSYQWTVWEDTTKVVSRAKVTGWGTPAGSTPVSDDWHTYAVDWSPDCLTFRFDHEIVGVVTPATTPWVTSALTTPVNIRLNLQVGQDYWGTPITSGQEATRFPATFDVDHVRAYAPR